MTQTIEQLTARVRDLEEQYELAANLANTSMDRVRELEEENVRLEAECDDIKRIQLLVGKLEAVTVGWKKQLAAEQLNNKLLREALEAVIKVHGYESGIPVEAISTQTSTEALDKYVAEKVKEYGDEARRQMQHATKAVWQRDLAVEALEKWDMFFGGDAETAVLTIAEDPSTLTGCQKATKEAMSAIKESEAK